MKIKIAKIQFILLFVALCGTLLTGCKENRLMYDSEPSIYIDLPFAKDNNNNNLPTRVSTLFYTFAYEESSMTEIEYHIPVEIDGFRMAENRSFNVRVSGGTAVENVDYKLLSEKCVIKANEGTGVIPIILYREIGLKTDSKTVKVTLEENQHFKISFDAMSEVTVDFSDILREPSWWKFFAYYLGPYHYIKHQEFIRISGLKEFDDDFAMANNSDIRYYIKQLSEYFQANERFELEDYPEAIGYPGNRITVNSPI